MSAGSEDPAPATASPQDAARERLALRLRAVAQGDRVALRDVYDLTSAKLFGICLRILPDRQEAEDVLQDVYLTVWRKAEAFDPARASPVTWLATIARNRAIDRRRSLAGRHPPAAFEAALDVPDDDEGALAGLERAEDAHRLRACLEELDGRTRGAIARAFFAGLTYQELARERAMPLGTVKSLIRRGLIRLRGCLEA
ncbi:sigma-70 family RNA polymerase sigma factor [Aureimonas populi]|uniref:RNA polymerase sigma factor n=1 Tax=Aureimonas populi TaxID=1701758 RepID=A0ABW5CK41_9HYPH|nr:sigma-70 family RNA polymerase sigma factor [Aureimonas populi]